MLTSSSLAMGEDVRRRVGSPAQLGTCRWPGDAAGALIEISGETVEAELGGSTLRLTRTIRAWCDRPVIEVHDVVTNDRIRRCWAYVSSPHQPGIPAC